MYVADTATRYVQWHAIAYILNELSIRPPSIIVDRAWRVTEHIFSEIQADHKTSMMWVPMRKLLAKAQRRREEDMQIYYPEHSLGINPRFYKPEMTEFSVTSIPAIDDVGRQRQLLQNPDLVHQTMQAPILTPSSDVSLEPPRTSMQTLQPVNSSGEPFTIQPQYMTRQVQAPFPAPFPILDESLLSDIDMNDLNGEVNWEGWDNMVRDYQQEVNANGEVGLGGFRGPPSFGEMGSWW